MAAKMVRQHIDGENWRAIQITTAAGVCAVLDLAFSGQLPDTGFLRQEQVGFELFMHNRFGQLFASDISGASQAHNMSLADINE